MTHPEHNAKTPSTATGLFARLRVFLRAPGRGALSSRRRRLLALGLLPGGVGVLLVLFALPAAAVESAPKLVFQNFQVSEVDSTRAAIEMGLVAEAGSASARATWQLEYSSTSAGGPWTLEQSGTIDQEVPRENSAEILHLTPQTHYFVRVVATSGETTAERTAEFTTTPVAPPVFFSPHSASNFDVGAGALPECSGYLYSINEDRFCAHSLPTPTSGFGGLTTEVYANGADTSYHFEYSTSKSAVESGSGTPVPGAAGSVTAAEGLKLAEVKLEGLGPETTYYLRGVAENGVAPPASTPILTFAARTARAQVSFGAYGINQAAASAHLIGNVSPNGFETRWRFEYSTSKSGPWTAGPEGTIAQAQAGYSEEGQRVEGELTGLSPGTPYYVRLHAENEPPSGHAEATSEAFGFETSGAPAVTTFATHAIHGEALRLLGYLQPDNAGLNEIQTVTVGGAPTGGSFTLTSNGQSALAPLEGEPAIGELTAGSQIVHFTTLEGDFQNGAIQPGESISGAGIPSGTTIIKVSTHERNESSTHRHLREYTLTLSQGVTVTSNSVALSIGLPRLPFDATDHEVQAALDLLSDVGENVAVIGPAGGPYVVEFINGKGSSSQPQLVADASGLTPSGSVTVATTQVGFSYATHYHFEFVTQRHFEAEGFTNAQSTPEVAFASVAAQAVGQDVPGLQPGEGYRYRLAATNTTPGDPVVHGAEQTLTVPAAASAGAGGTCPNEALRSGASATLPDCRAYEQVTPVDKEGAEQPFHYGIFETGNSGMLTGEDGDHVEFDGQFVHWGTAGGSPYFFARGEHGWGMTAATPQPEAGIDIHYAPELYNPDLTQFAFSAGWKSGPTAESSGLEFKLGSPGGPYAPAASVSRTQTGPAETSGWVAASEDFSKLIFATEDRTLIHGHATHTSEGLDLYEYSQGQLHQANVDSAGKTIGSCGATVAKGLAETQQNGTTSSRHSVSADGSRVFFYAVPGASCAEPRHLYLRVGGAETTDLGAYTLLGANREGSEALLEARSATTQEVLLYEAGSHAITHLFSLAAEAGTSALELAQVSEDLSAIYFKSNQRLTPEAPPGGGYFYRYDIPARVLSFAFQGETFESGPAGVSPDGRYAYLQGDVAAVPGGSGPGRQGSQIYRYDSVEHVVECVSCASPFDPEPKWPALSTNEELGSNSFTRNGAPGEVIASGNGDYVFFDTVSALVTQDVNGEIPPEAAIEKEYTSSNLSPSSDVYEWRKPGVGGCTSVQGCVSLISSGTSGRLVMLLGSAAEGRDVFFTTASQLVSQDQDSALDIYDARIGGGFAPPPPRPSECEGDACSTPFSAPSDLTPSSLTFQGAGNLVPAIGPKAPAKPKPKSKKPCKAKARGKCKAKPKHKTKKKAQKRGRKAGRPSRRAGSDRRAAR